MVFILGLGTYLPMRFPNNRLQAGNNNNIILHANDYLAFFFQILAHCDVPQQEFLCEM